FASVGRGLALLARGRFGEFARRIFKGLPDSRRMDADGDHARAAYAAWRRQREMTDANRQRLRAEAAAMAKPPGLSIVTPVYNPPEMYMKRALQLGLRQTYPHWELCSADDGSTAKHVDRLLRKYEA